MVYPSKLSTDSIVSAAVALVDAQGVGGLGMRAVADVLHVRPASLYKHVGDLASLQAHVAERAAAMLRGKLERALGALRHTHTDHAAAAVHSTARAYVAFAREHPGLYAALTTDTAQAPGAAQHPQTERKLLWNVLLRVVGLLTQHDDDTAAAVATWSLLHGFVALEAAGMFGESGPQLGFERGVLALVRGLPPASPSI